MAVPRIYQRALEPMPYGYLRRGETREFPSCSARGGEAARTDPGHPVASFRRVNQMHPGRDARRAVRLEAGLVGNQVCSLGGSGEHANPAKLFETLGFSVSPPVNPLPPLFRGQIRDSSRNFKQKATGYS